LANSVGVIDNLFSGPDDEIKMIIQYTGGFFPDIIKKGERVGQLILEKNNEIEWDEQEDRNFAQVSRGGFGSSGV
jgi:dUTPase